MRPEHGVLALAIAGWAFATLNGDTTTPGGQAAGISLGVDVTTDGNPHQRSARSTLTPASTSETRSTSILFVTDVTDFRE